MVLRKANSRTRGKQVRWPLLLSIAIAIAMLTSPAQAADKEHGTLIQEVPMYVAPDATSQKVAMASRGRDVLLVIARSTVDGKDWAQVLVVVDTARMEPREVSGWVESRMVITNATPNGDQIIFGEAVDSENQAE